MRQVGLEVALCQALGSQPAGFNWATLVKALVLETFSCRHQALPCAVPLRVLKEAPAPF